MLSVIILCGAGGASGDRPETVVRTLAPLVQASVKGLVRDVVLAGPPEADLAMIADHAGCAFIEAGQEADALSQALSMARAEDLMILYAGHVPEAGFFEEVEDLLAMGLPPERGGRLLRAAPESFIERLFPRLAPAVGLIAARSLCEAAKVVSFRDLRRITRVRKTLRRRLRRIA
ncbi:MAG: transposase [Methylovirgula sp.]